MKVKIKSDIPLESGNVGNFVPAKNVIGFLDESYQQIGLMDKELNRKLVIFHKPYQTMGGKLYKDFLPVKWLIPAEYLEEIA